MIIQTATFKNLHGHLSPDLKFLPDVNILIGVNGSGKTSVLNAISWILSPSSIQGGLPAAYLLANLQFDTVEIGYAAGDGSKRHRVRAKRTEDHVEIRVDSIEEALCIPVMDPQGTVWYRARRTEEEAADFYTRFLDDHQNNSVMRHLALIPGPRYLPLDRRSAEEDRRPPRRPNLRRSTTAGHIPADAVLERAIRGRLEEAHQTNALNERLRDDLLTALIDDSEVRPDAKVLTLPQVNALRSRVGAALDNLRLPKARELSEKLFAKLEDSARQFGGQGLPEDFLDGPDLGFWLNWGMTIAPIGVRLQKLIPIIEQYESQVADATARTTSFLSSVNTFLSENGKHARFLTDTNLVVELPHGQTIDSQNLPSGELQLLILFAFLYFTFDDATQAFPVLVDEPELSLHIAWQNQYVKSITEANPYAQFILATHSPEIAGPHEDHLIDISPLQVAT